MANKSKSDRIHDLLPALLNSHNDENWKAVVGAIGDEDDRLAQLIETVRNQFFVKTANRPYLDRLAANNNISRPKFIGIGDSDFRRYIPVLSYQPKQVKKVVETLLDLFFFKEATTAFLSSGTYGPYGLKEGWSLDLTVDNIYPEHIVFSAADFSDLSNATTDELVAAYNRQAKYSYAVNFFDSVSNHNYVRIFTNTIGNEGSLQVAGGLANISLQLNGFMADLGTGLDTQWNITKVGDQVMFTYTGGTLPGLDKLEVGDIVLCDLAGNEGSFPITAIDVQTNSFQFTNLFATIGIVTQSADHLIKFVRPEKFGPYRSLRRALVWETRPGQITVEMPATPTIVQRELKGGFHINGVKSTVVSTNGRDSLTVLDASTFPASGKFVIEPVNSLAVQGDGSTVETSTSNGRLISGFVRYSYTGIQGNTLLGISPLLPATLTGIDTVQPTSMSRTNGVVTCVGANDFLVGENVVIRDSIGIPTIATSGTVSAGSPIITSVADVRGVAPGQLVSGANVPAGTKVLNVIIGSNSVVMSNSATGNATGLLSFAENLNGVFSIVSASSTQFTFNSLGLNGTLGPNSQGVIATASVERLLMADKNSKIIVTSAVPASETGLTGSYVWDQRASFVLSSNTATLAERAVAGKIKQLLSISTNTIPSQGGYVVFDYGQATQEGPVRYLYKPNDNVLVLDPSYVFQNSHEVGASVVAVSHNGPHIMSGLGNEYPPYLTNPSDARLVLEELIHSVTSAGIYIDFLVRYPTQLYGAISTYE